MIDIRELRKNPGAYLTRLSRKGAGGLVQELLDVDGAWRAATAASEELRARLKSSGKPTPDQLQQLQRAKEEFQEEEGLVRELDLPYRVINVAAGDLGAPAVKKSDIEAWFPGQGRYRAITSTSNTTDFQSRRLEIRFRRAGKPEPVHTLNGTAITARAMIAILENFQEADGSIAVPSVLWEFGAPRKLGTRRARG